MGWPGRTTRVKAADSATNMRPPAKKNRLRGTSRGTSIRTRTVDRWIHSDPGRRQEEENRRECSGFGENRLEDVRKWPVSLKNGSGFISPRDDFRDGGPAATRRTHPQPISQAAEAEPEASPTQTVSAFGKEKSHFWR